MPTVTEDIDLPGVADNLATRVTIEISLAGSGGVDTRGFHTSTNTTIVSPYVFALNTATTVWELDLFANDEISPAGTTYKRVIRIGSKFTATDYFIVPVGGGPYNLDNLLTAAPAQIENSSVVALQTRFFSPNVYVASAFGHHRWFAAREEAGTRKVLVQEWGGSVADGSPGPTDPLTTSFLGRVETHLRSTYGDGGSGYRTISRSTTTGTWTTEVGFASVGARATSAATRQFTGLMGTEIKIYYRNANITGSFQYQIDGGGFTVVTPPTGFGAEPGVTTVSGLPDVPHTVDIEWISGDIVIHGVQATYDTGIVTQRCARGGTAYAQYGRIVLDQFPIGITNASPTVTSPSPGVFRSSMEGRYLSSVQAGLPFNAQIDTVTDAQTATISANATATATINARLTANRTSDAEAVNSTIMTNAFAEGLSQPDLVIVTCGLNDNLFTGSTGSTGPGTASGDIFRDGMSNFLRAFSRHRTAFDFTPDFLFVIEHLGNSSDVNGSGDHIAAQIHDFAMGIGAAVVDIWGMGRRNFQYWDDLGYWGDAFFHPNDAGAQFMADQVTPVLDRDV